MSNTDIKAGSLWRSESEFGTIKILMVIKMCDKVFDYILLWTNNEAMKPMIGRRRWASVCYYWPAFAIKNLTMKQIGKEK
jgi:hypothetical protein